MAPGIADEAIYMIIGKHTESHQQTAGNINAHHDRITKLEEEIIALSGGSGSTLTGGNGITINNNDISIEFTEFTADDITEGTTNLFHTSDRVDARVLPVLANKTDGVGIGTTSTAPQGSLHVAGQSSGTIYISDSVQGLGTAQSLLISKSGYQSFIQNKDNGKLILGTNSAADDFVIDTTHNIGIAGAVSPNALLHIGTNHATGTETYPGLQIGGATTYRFGVYTTAEGAVIHNKNGDDGISFKVKGTTDDALRIAAVGTNPSPFIGIGTIIPSNKLHVNSGNTNIAAQFESTDGTGGIMLKDSSGNVELTTSGTNGFNIHPAGGAPVFRIEGNGNVGIGTGTNTLNGLLNIRGTGDAIRIESTNTGAGGAQIDLLHHTTAPSDNDVHGVINFGGYTQSGSDQAYGSSIKSIWTNAAAKQGALEIWTRDGSAGWQHHFKVNHHGGLALGPGNEGYEGQVLSIKSGNDTNVLYGESTASMCLVSTRSTGSTANIGFGAEGNAHVFTSDASVRVKINSANITLANYVNIGRTGSGAMAIFGHNTEVDETINNKVVAATNALQSQFIRMYHDHGISFHCSSQTHSANHTLYNLNDNTNPYERVRIHDTGEVSIGNTTIINSGATTFLSVGDGSGSATISIYTGASSYGYLNFARGTSGVAADPGYIRYNHNDDSFLFASGSGGSVHIGTGGGEAGGLTGGASFSNDTNNRKNLICATTSTSNLELIEFRNPHGTVGTIKSNGTSTTFNTSSDYRLKENVNYEWDASTRLKQLKPARFNFKTDKDTVDGFLAHEVSDIVPNAISGEKDGEKMQSIDHSKLVPLLTKAIQEQQAQIEALQSEINLLKGE